MGHIVKNTTFTTPLDLIAPHSCLGCGRISNILCPRCKKNILNHRQNLCPICHQLTPNGHCSNCIELPPTYIVDKKSSLVGELVREFKYSSIRALAKPLAELINSSLPDDLPAPVIIVPLPTISRHIRERGFDHTACIAKNLANLRPCFSTQNLLIRNKNTIQVGADRSIRLQQVAAAYALNPKSKIDQNATYLLLDDVWTTGATMDAAFKKLQQAGAQNIIISVLALSGL